MRGSALAQRLGDCAEIAPAKAWSDLSVRSCFFSFTKYQWSRQFHRRDLVSSPRVSHPRTRAARQHGGADLSQLLIPQPFPRT